MKYVFNPIVYMSIFLIKVTNTELIKYKFLGFLIRKWRYWEL